MKRYDALNAPEAGAPFVNADLIGGTEGSYPPAEGFDAVMTEIQTAIVAAGLDPTNADWAQLAAAIKIIARNLIGSAYDDTGAANAYVITPAPVVAAYATYQLFVFKAAHANNAASTFKANALPDIPIKRIDGTALQAGDILADMICVGIHDGASLILLNRNDPVATQVQVDAGTDDNARVTAKKLRWGFAYSFLAAGGFIVFPTFLKSFTIQWGFVTVTGGTTAAFSLPIAFPNLALGGISNKGATITLSGETAVGTTLFSNTNITISNSRASAVAQGITYLTWGY